MQEEYMTTDEELLKHLKTMPEFVAVDLQRLSGWGYNRAAHKIDAWVRSSKVVSLSDKPYAFAVLDSAGARLSPG